jgi:hypothetical protein
MTPSDDAERDVMRRSWAIKHQPSDDAERDVMRRSWGVRGFPCLPGQAGQLGRIRRRR